MAREGNDISSDGSHQPSQDCNEASDTASRVIESIMSSAHHRRSLLRTSSPTCSRRVGLGQIGLPRDGLASRSTSFSGFKHHYSTTKAPQGATTLSQACSLAAMLSEICKHNSTISFPKLEGCTFRQCIEDSRNNHNSSEHEQYINTVDSHRYNKSSQPCRQRSVCRSRRPRCSLTQYTIDSDLDQERH